MVLYKQYSLRSRRVKMNRLGKMVLGLVVLIGCSNVQSQVLHGIPGGDYSTMSSGGTQTITGAGYWTYSSSENASVKVVGEGDARHVELWQNWYPRGASHWYVDNGTTPLDLPWIITGDMKWSVAEQGKAKKAFVLSSTDNLSAGTVFNMVFRYNSVTWKAGSITGTASVSLTDTYKTASIEYDPVTGKAVGKFGGELVFDVVTETNLVVKSVGFSNGTDSTSWEPGTLSVDNTTANYAPSVVFFTPAGGIITDSEVVITCQTSDAVIRYTTDGSDPSETNGTLIASGGSVQIDQALTLKALAWIDGIPGRITSAAYEPKVKTPKYTLCANYISGPRTITITCDTPGATIYYTTNGYEPSDASAVYSTPVLVDDGTILQACAYKAGYIPSEIKSVTYTVPTFYNRPETIPHTPTPILVDGDLSDWADATWAPLDEFYDGYTSDIQSAFYAAKWGSDGKIYVAVKVQEHSASSLSFTDNFVSSEGADQVEIYLHTTSLTGYTYDVMMSQESAQQYYIGIKASDHSQVWTGMIMGKAIPENTGFQAAGSVDANGLIIYEASMVAYDYFGGRLGLPSILSPLAANDVIGLDVVVTGYDSGYTGMRSENLMWAKYKYWTNLGLHKLEAGLALIPGDANGDGMVNVGDLGILAANYGGSDKTWEQGDFNNDGLVNVGDLGILAANYGAGVNGAADFAGDYAKVFGSAVEDDDSEVTEGSSLCSGLGLPLLAGLLLAGLMLVKLEE
jgi:hypothetical protein